MKTLIALLILTTLFTACGEEGGTSAPSNKAPSLAPGVDPIDPGQSQPVVPVYNPPTSGTQLTYYKLVETTQPRAGYSHTVTLTASCVSYQNKDYCWDDGVQPVYFTAGLIIKYSYFNIGISKASGNFITCWLQGSNNGECSSSVVTEPIWVNNMFTGMATQAKIDHVFQSGNPIGVTCNEANGLLNCGDFTINLNHKPLAFNPATPSNPYP